MAQDPKQMTDEQLMNAQQYYSSVVRPAANKYLKDQWQAMPGSRPEDNQNFFDLQADKIAKNAMKDKNSGYYKQDPQVDLTHQGTAYEPGGSLSSNPTPQAPKDPNADLRAEMKHWGFTDDEIEKEINMPMYSPSKVSGGEGVNPEAAYQQESDEERSAFFTAIGRLGQKSSGDTGPQDPWS